jgi:hypothetical protein
MEDYYEKTIEIIDDENEIKGFVDGKLEFWLSFRHDEWIIDKFLSSGGGTEDARNRIKCACMCFNQMDLINTEKLKLS